MTKHIIAITVGLLVTAGSARADDFDVSDKDLANIARKLQLTKQQRNHIRNLHDTVRKATIKLRAEIEATGIDLRRELDRDTPNEVKVGKYIARISQLEGKARQLRVVTWLRIRKLLHASQRKQLGKARLEHKLAWARSGKHHRHLRREMRELRRAERRLQRELRRMRKRSLAIERKKLAKIRKALRKHQHGILVDPFGHKRGKLVIAAKPWAKVYVDGKHLGTTPLRTTLPAGVHRLELQWSNKRRTVTVRIKAGETTKVVLAK